MTGQRVRARFDRDGFYAALDTTRQIRGLTWRQAATQAGVSASTFTRLGDGYAPDVDGFAALVTWLGVPADQFIFIHRVLPATEPEPFAALLARFRRNPGLTPTAAAAFEQIALAAYTALRNETALQPTATDASKR